MPVDVPLLIVETKIACTTGMLLCLDRKQRLIFTLGEVLGVSDTVGSDILEMSADNFRQCLARARRDLYQFMTNQCGLVNASNPCRCPKKTRGFIDGGHVDPKVFDEVRALVYEELRKLCEPPPKRAMLLCA